MDLQEVVCHYRHLAGQKHNAELIKNKEKWVYRCRTLRRRPFHHCRRVQA